MQRETDAGASDVPPPRRVATRLTKGTSAFLIAGLLQQGLLFLLLPLLTRALPPAEFGRITVATTVAGLAAIVMGLGLETPVFRAWFATSDDQATRHSYLQTARTLIGVSSATVLAVLAVGAWLLPIQSDAWSPLLVTLAGLGAVATVAVSNYVLPLLRAQDRLRAYMTVKLTLAIAQPLLLALFVLLLGWGAVGWIVASAVAGWTAAMVAARKMRPVGGVGTIEGEARRELLGLGLPLIPHALSHWALTGADRLILVAFVSSASVGVYGLSYRIAQLSGTVITELNRAVMNEYGRLVSFADDPLERDKRLGGLGELQIAATVAITFLLAILGPPVFDVLFPAEYVAGAAVLPWVALGYGFFGIYFVPTNILVLIEGRSGWLWTGTVSAAAVNLAANLLLIPRHGIVGAAQATAISYAVMLMIIWVYARRVSSTRPRMRWWRILTLIALAGALGITNLRLSLDGMAAWALPIASSLLVGVLAGLVAWDALRTTHGSESGTAPGA